MVEQDRTTWGYPRMLPYAVLAAVGLLGAVQAFAVAVLPPTDDLDRTVYAVMGVLALALSVVLITIGPRIGRPILIGVTLLATAMVSVLAWVSGTPEGQLLLGFSLLMLGVYSAYFLSIRVVIVQLSCGVVLYGAALWANPQLVRPWYGIAVLVIDVAVTLVVASLVGRLRVQALHDPLTGAFNRRGLEDSATLAHDLDVRGHHVTTIVEIDLDGFKQYNDTHGHVAGDARLADAVRAWRGVLRRTDILARTGGDEFVLILPATGRTEAHALVARMREASEVPWTAGLAEWRQGEALPEALRHADDELYRGKSDRNRAAT
jgi:diguanylate cyclase (GGDEF)-like protein